MENTKDGNAMNDFGKTESWQLAENQDNEQRSSDSETANDWDFRQAEAGGYEGDESGEKRVANDREDNDNEDDDDEDNDDEDNDDEDNDDEDTSDRDWGTVDPQEHPGISSDMDPSGPGSAV